MKANFFCTPLCSSNLTNVRRLISLKFSPSSFSPYLLSNQVKISSGCEGVYRMGAVICGVCLWN